MGILSSARLASSFDVPDVAWNAVSTGAGEIDRHRMPRRANARSTPTEADTQFQLTQRKRITLGVLAKTKGMTAKELGDLLQTNSVDELAA